MLKNTKKIVRNNKTIFQNLSYLSILQIFNVLIPLFTYPYLIRVLGSEKYGLIIFAQSIVNYFVILMNFGFNTTATREISINRGNRYRIAEIVSSVFIIKGILLILSIILFVLVLYLVPEAKDNKLLFSLTLYLLFYELIFPIWYFQGIEKMKYVTIFNVIGRIIFLVLIFVLINDKSDYILYPAIGGVAMFIASVFALKILFWDDGINLIIPSNRKLAFYFKKSIPIFISNISVFFFANSSKVLIGIFLGMKELSYFDLAEKLANLLKFPQGILTQTLFPKISQDRNMPFVKRVFKISLILNFVIYIVFIFFLKEIIIMLGGKEMLSAYTSAIILGISAPLIVLTTVFGIQTLLPFGYNKQFSKAATLSVIFYVIILIIIYFTLGFSINNIAFATVITIVFEAVYLFKYCLEFKLWNLPSLVKKKSRKME